MCVCVFLVIDPIYIRSCCGSLGGGGGCCHGYKGPQDRNLLKVLYGFDWLYVILPGSSLTLAGARIQNEDSASISYVAFICDVLWVLL